jgi:hypothetical protein
MKELKKVEPLKKTGRQTLESRARRIIAEAAGGATVPILAGRQAAYGDVTLLGIVTLFGPV